MTVVAPPLAQAGCTPIDGRESSYTTESGKRRMRPNTCDDGTQATRTRHDTQNPVLAVARKSKRCTCIKEGGSRHAAATIGTPTRTQTVDKEKRPKHTGTERGRRRRAAFSVPSACVWVWVCVRRVKQRLWPWCCTQSAYNSKVPWTCWLAALVVVEERRRGGCVGTALSAPPVFRATHVRRSEILSGLFPRERCTAAC